MQSEYHVLVSVVMPAYNSSEFIAGSIQSCLDQTHQNLEVIVVDDGSTDTTAQIVQGFDDPRIRYIYQENAGPSSARNTGIKSANGDYIKFCDSDDILFSDHVEKCLDVFSSAPDHVAVVYTRYQHVMGDGVTPRRDMQDPPLLSGDIFCKLLRSNAVAILTSASMVRRSACFEVGLFDETPNFHVAEDWDFYLKLAIHYEYRSIDEILLNYRRHADGLTARADLAAFGRLKALQNMQIEDKRLDCMTEKEFNALLAGRYHQYAMSLWKLERTTEARNAFRSALELTDKSRLLRQLFLWLTYWTSPRVAFRLNQLIRQVRS